VTPIIFFVITEANPTIFLITNNNIFYSFLPIQRFPVANILEIQYLFRTKLYLQIVYNSIRL
jgi:hypothetical protein